MRLAAVRLRVELIRLIRLGLFGLYVRRIRFLYSVARGLCVKWHTNLSIVKCKSTFEGLLANSEAFFCQGHAPWQFSDNSTFDIS